MRNSNLRNQATFASRVYNFCTFSLGRVVEDMTRTEILTAIEKSGHCLTSEGCSRGRMVAMVRQIVHTH